MPQLLELPHFVEQHGVPEMQIGRRRIEAGFHAQRLTSVQLANQIRFGQQVLRTTLELGESLGRIRLGHVGRIGSTSHRGGRRIDPGGSPRYGALTPHS